MPQGELENNSWSPETYLKKGVSLKKSQLILSPGIIKKGDVIIHADDDEVRTSVSQNRATATLSTEGFFLE